MLKILTDLINIVNILTRAPQYHALGERWQKLQTENIGCQHIPQVGHVEHFFHATEISPDGQHTGQRCGTENGRSQLVAHAGHFQAQNFRLSVDQRLLNLPDQALAGVWGDGEDVIGAIVKNPANPR